MIYGDPTNFVALTIAELDDTPLYFTDDIGIVLGLPMMLGKVLHGRPALGYGGLSLTL
jgi:hypothetical protein